MGCYGGLGLPRSSAIRIEVVDPETGGKVTVTVEGAVPRVLSESIGKYISNLLSSGQPSLKANVEIEKGASPGEHGASSTYERVRSLLLKNFRYGSFTSRDVQDEFERASGEKLRASTVSTYLLRLSDETNGILERRHGVGGYEYRLRSENIKSQGSEAERIHATRNSTK
jgi:hypothetical protein